MARVEFLASLPLDQIGYAPTGPQPRTISQHLCPLFQSAAQLLQLGGLQPGFATCAPGLLKASLALVLPIPIPPTSRFTGNIGFTRNFSLAKSLLKELSRLQPAPFQRLEITFDTFWIAHAQDYSTGPKY